jgi:hypothetical protein
LTFEFVPEGTARVHRIAFVEVTSPDATPCVKSAVAAKAAGAAIQDAKTARNAAKSQDDRFIELSLSGEPAGSHTV